jgi:transcription initiation factor IIF auxiliary subunit
MSPETLHLRQSAEYEGEDTWTWAVWIEGPPHDLDRIAYVEYTLHPTFPKPVRRITDRSTQFRLETGGWGTFTIYATMVLKDGSTLPRLEHELELYYPNGQASTA